MSDEIEMAGRSQASRSAMCCFTAPAASDSEAQEVKTTRSALLFSILLCSAHVQPQMYEEEC